MRWAASICRFIARSRSPSASTVSTAAGAGAKRCTAQPSAVGAVEGHLDDRDLAALAPQQLDRGMDGEGGGVVVGMTALVGMGQHDLGRPLQEQPARARATRGRWSAASWSATPRQNRSATGMPASIMTRSSSRAPRESVLGGGRKAVPLGIARVARRAVGDVDHGDAVEPRQLRAGADRLVVRMGDDHGDGCGRGSGARSARARRKAAARSGAVSGCSLATARMPPVYTAACSSSSFDAPALGA